MLRMSVLKNLVKFVLVTIFCWSKFDFQLDWVATGARFLSFLSIYASCHKDAVKSENVKEKETPCSNGVSIVIIEIIQ